MGIAKRWQGLPELPPAHEDQLDRPIPLLERTGVRLAYLFGSLADRSIDTRRSTPGSSTTTFGRGLDTFRRFAREVVGWMEGKGH